MTFDEARWEWHDINQTAAASIIAILKQIAAESHSLEQVGSSYAASVSPLAGHLALLHPLTTRQPCSR